MRSALPPLKKPLRPNQILLRIGLSVVLLLLGTLGLFFAPIWDIAPPSFPDLAMPPRPVVDEELNLYIALKTLGEVDIGPDHAMKLAWSSVRRDTPSAEEIQELKKYVASQEDIVTFLRDALARCTHHLAPEAPSHSSRSETAGVQLSLAAMLGMRVQQAILEAEPSLAMDSIRLQYQVAALTLERPEFVIEYLTTSASLGLAHNSVQNALYSGILDVDDLHEIQKRLPSREAFHNGLRSAILSEFQVVNDTLQRVRDGRLRLEDIVDSDVPEFLLGLNSVLYLPNETLGFFGEFFRSQLQTLRAWEMYDLRERPASPEPSHPEWSRLDIRNGLGRILFLTEKWPTDIFYTHVQENSARLEILRVQIALHLYRQANGGFPARLEDLMPVYLETVPLDPFDGNPLRYDPVALRIWSVGQDGVDDGGSARRASGARIRMQDLVHGVAERVLPEKKTATP